MFFTKVFKDSQESFVFLFHFLVMASALFCFSGAYKLGHGFEDFVHTTKMFVDVMFVVDFKEPMVPFVFFKLPMSSIE